MDYFRQSVQVHTHTHTHTHAACRAERSGLKASRPSAITSLSRVQRRVLSVENDYFKWQCFMNNNHVSVYHPFLNEKNDSGEPLLDAITKHKKSLLERLKIKYLLTDTCDYVLSKVHNSVEKQNGGSQHPAVDQTHKLAVFHLST
jgi:hypothetical protein